MKELLESMFKIVSDSACDLSQAYINENDIDIVPLSVSFDGEQYFLDGVDILRHLYQAWTFITKLLKNM